MKRLLIGGVALLAACSAWAQDLAPVIDHQPTARAARGQPLEIQARITSVSGKAIYEPTVLVRVAGISGFSRVSMHRVAGSSDVYAAEVPAALTTGDFDYYIEAFDEDGNGPGRAGTPEYPLHVAVGGSGAATPPPPPVTAQPAQTQPAGQGLLEGQQLKFAGQDPRTMDTGNGKIIVGSVLSGVGIVALIYAIVTLNASSAYYAAGDSTDGAAALGFGALALVAGIALAATGAVLLAIGLVRQFRYVAAMKEAGLSIRLEQRPHATVVALAMRF